MPNTTAKRKVLLIGLDSAPPELLYRFLDRMPTVKRLVENGLSARMESCNPPITVPAWMVMMTGLDPGRLGLYGFRHRRVGSYSTHYLVNSNMIGEPTVWDIIAKNGMKSCLIGVPPSYPVKPISGNLISCFLTPSTGKEFTYPKELKNEVSQVIGEYEFDVTFRTDDRDAILESIRRMTKKRFDLINYLAERKDWEFFMFVEIGLDRIHHTFWKFFDRTHHKFESGNKFENVVEEYYIMLDERIGDLIKRCDDDTIVVIASDHGSKAMKGAFCINEWLIQEGYLTLESEPEGIVDIEKAQIDWSKTKAWAWGGYYARIFFNLTGREALGVVEKEDIDSLSREIKSKLMNLVDQDNRPMRNKVFTPDELYQRVEGDSPDLMVYLDELNWRAAGTIGHGALYLDENDTGPDDSVHSMDGIFILYDPMKSIRMDLGTISIMDVAPTLLRIFEIPIPQDMTGRVIDV